MTKEKKDSSNFPDIIEGKGKELIVREGTMTKTKNYILRC